MGKSGWSIGDAIEGQGLDDRSPALAKPAVSTEREEDGVFLFIL
jgi:hypothetical protein